MKARIHERTTENSWKRLALASICCLEQSHKRTYDTLKSQDKPVEHENAVEKVRHQAIEKHKCKELLVSKSNTVPHPWTFESVRLRQHSLLTMMIHFENTSLTSPAVMTSIWFVVETNLTIPEHFVLSLPLNQGELSESIAVFLHSWEGSKPSTTNLSEPLRNPEVLSMYLMMRVETK